MAFSVQRVVINVFFLFIFSLPLVFFPQGVGLAEEQEYYVKEIDVPFRSEADPESSVIFPLSRNQKLIEKDQKDDWVQVLEPTRGLVGWVRLKDLSLQRLTDTGEPVVTGGFKVFEDYFTDLNHGLEETLGEKPFIGLKKIKDGVAQVLANDFWLDSSRHEHNAFNLFNTWKGANGGKPSILSFADKDGDEKFIIIDGPHRPRYLKRQPN